MTISKSKSSNSLVEIAFETSSSKISPKSSEIVAKSADDNF